MDKMDNINIRAQNELIEETLRNVEQKEETIRAMVDAVGMKMVYKAIIEEVKLALRALHTPPLGRKSPKPARGEIVPFTHPPKDNPPPKGA